jgi:hypothetical protein
LVLAIPFSGLKQPPTAAATTAAMAAQTFDVATLVWARRMAHNFNLFGSVVTMIILQNFSLILSVVAMVMQNFNIVTVVVTMIRPRHERINSRSRKQIALLELQVKLAKVGR